MTNKILRVSLLAVIPTLKTVFGACLLTISCVAMMHAQSDPPELASWLRNTNGRVGYNNIPADVQLVRYSANYVYVNSTGIPAFSIGPWPGNPNIPTNQNFVFKIARSPAVNTGTKTSTQLGPIAVWINGAAVFNALDGFSYNNQNIWHRNAVVAEATSFDGCLGHPAPGGVYHNHQNPRCMYSADSTHHSPLLGYTFDGYPIYGPYGYSNPNGTGGIARIASSYRLRNITQRHTLPDSTVLPPSQYGPDVSPTYPLGLYAEDYEYVNGLGPLDRYNGRTGVTPEYPGATYAYFVNINADGSSAYPYVIGPQYNGIVVMENITTGGHVAVTESVTVYNPPTSVDEKNALPHDFALQQNYPNPFNPTTIIKYQLPKSSYVTLKVFDLLGREISVLVDGLKEAGLHEVSLDASQLASGAYFYRLQAGSFIETRKLVLLR
ncbi:MAG TPA: YHYH protein [Bacteroidota bacterium]|nr:YHYH protein [Bacteroidota bacterium]